MNPLSEEFINLLNVANEEFKQKITYSTKDDDESVILDWTIKIKKLKYCKTCGYSTVQTKRYKNHVNKHQASINYEFIYCCPLCNFSAKNQDILNKHLHNHSLKKQEDEQEKS